MKINTSFIGGVFVFKTNDRIIFMKTKIGFKETLEWYEQNASTYSNKIADKSDLFLLERFMEKLPVEGKILDAGSAGGRDCEIFAQKGFQPTGIDAVKSLVKEAKTKNPDIDFVHESFTNLPFEKNFFDGVWAHASLLHLENIEDVKKALSEFFRVLKTNGIAHIFVKKQLGKEKTSNVSQEYSSDFDRFFRWFTKDELSQLIEEAGFKIIQFDDDYTPKDGRKSIKWLAVLAKKI